VAERFKARTVLHLLNPGIVIFNAARLHGCMTVLVYVIVPCVGREALRWSESPTKASYQRF